MPREWLDGGFMIKAASLRELAEKTGLNADALSATIDRFNAFARKGVDEDFQRGGNRFDNGWGDPFHGPNPNLGTLEKTPFYAIRIWPGDLGTKGGLLTDGDGRVMDREGQPIAGLYAARNGRTRDGLCVARHAACRCGTRGNDTMIDPADFAELQQLVWLYSHVIDDRRFSRANEVFIEAASGERAHRSGKLRWEKVLQAPSTPITASVMPAPCMKMR